MVEVEVEVLNETESNGRIESLASIDQQSKMLSYDITKIRINGTHNSQLLGQRYLTACATNVGTHLISHHAHVNTPHSR